MGNFREHILFGFLAAVSALYIMDYNLYLGVSEAVVVSLSVALGSVLPDIDHKRAYVHRAVKAFTSLSIGVLVLLLIPLKVYYSFAIASAAFLAVYFMFSHAKIQHRGFTHSFSFLTIVSSLVVILGVYSLSSAAPGLAIGLGMLSHLLLDREFKLS